MADQEDPKHPAPLDIFPRAESSSNGTSRAYSVEARLAYHTPRQVSGQLLDLRWQRLQFANAPIGVPPCRPHEWATQASGLLSYQAAQALRWWFLAQAELEFSCLCVETRLVEHAVSYSCSSTAIKAVAPIGGNDRSNIMYGWGDKEAATERKD